MQPLKSDDSDIQMNLALTIGQVSEHTKQIFVEHNYALNLKIKGEEEFKCLVCGYTTDTRSRFRRHKLEHCDTKPKRSKACPICGKVYTHNGLRDHLRNYTVPNRAFRGVHKNFTAQHHINLLVQLPKKQCTISN